MMSESTDAVHAAGIDQSLQLLKQQVESAQIQLRNGQHENLLMHLRGIDQHVEGLKVDAVMRARRWGISWASVGAALSISKQAAWEKFGKPYGQ